MALSYVSFWFIITPWLGTWWGPAALGITVVQPGFAGVLLFLYSMAMEAASGGATIGKRAVNLRVIAISGDMDIGKAAIRNVSKIYGLFLLLDWLVGFVSDGDQKQKWLDRVAGTTVVLTTALTEAEQHLYQSQQSKYAPPPQEKYETRHESAYHYPPEQATQKQPQKQDGTKAAAPSPDDALCIHCGGKMAETGAGRLKCIRCGKIQ